MLEENITRHLKMLGRIMNSNHNLDDILINLCKEEDVSYELLKKLIEIEKNYQNTQKRFGIYEKIKSQTEKELEKDRDAIK